jgi:hypothetical protein
MMFSHVGWFMWLGHQGTTNSLENLNSKILMSNECVIYTLIWRKPI